MSTSNKIELQVDHHPSGNRTLKQRISGESTWIDLRNGLFANDDSASFYKGVVKHISELTTQGNVVTNLTDTSP